MRPHRVRLTHSLVSHYDLEKSMVLHRPKPRSETQIEEFHADDYVKFLKAVTPDNQDEFLTQMRRFNLGSVGEADCPVFDGLFEYCSVSFFWRFLERASSPSETGEGKILSSSLSELLCFFLLSPLLSLQLLSRTVFDPISPAHVISYKYNKKNTKSYTLAARLAAPPCSTTREPMCASTGPEGCTTPRRQKPRASATSTISCWLSWSC